jgi:murein DD-endopeptidase MepM/ murein hydrolase activator NlpD
MRTVRPAGSHRLPAPPAASLRGRITIAAAAAGAAVAAVQTVAPGLFPALDGVEPIRSTGLVPVADTTTLGAKAAFAIGAIDGDQVLPGATRAAVDPTAAVDVRNLAKAVDIGHALARRTTVINAALSQGATEAHIVGDEAFVRPASGRLTSVFGARWGTSHLGIDIANAIGTPIYAFTDGVVEKAGAASGFGLWVVLRHPDGTHSVYGHVNRMFVQEGQRVQAGEQIAEVGNRGHSTGPHLHLEIWDSNRTKIDPIPWLKKHGIAFDGSKVSVPADGPLPDIGPDAPGTVEPTYPTGTSGVLAAARVG